MSVIVSARIEEESKAKADKYGIKIGRLLRKALEKEIDDIERKMIAGKLDGMPDTLRSKFTKEGVADMIRSDRDER